MRTVKRILGLTLMIVVCAAVYASAQQAPPPAQQAPTPAPTPAVQDIKSLAGKYTGWGTPASGSAFPIEVQIKPDGSYTVMSAGATSGQGNLKVVDGKITTEGYLGGGDPTKGASQASVSTKGGKTMISGQGRNDRGPFNYELTKQ
jgi:hypothetical protein